MSKAFLTTLLLTAASALQAADIAAPAAAPASTPSVLPEVYPQSRYAQLREKCPFALATPDDTPKPPEKTFADGWKIKGIARIPEGGKMIDLVTVRSGDARETYTLETGKDKDGITLVSVEWSPELGKSKATIKKNGEFAKLEYDETDMKGGAPTVAGPRPGVPPMPGVPQQNAMGARPPMAPTNRVLLPRQVTGIPTPAPSGIPHPISPVNTFPANNNNVRMPVAPQGNVQSGAPQDNRRRVRYIPGP